MMWVGLLDRGAGPWATQVYAEENKSLKGYDLSPILDGSSSPEEK